MPRKKASPEAQQQKNNQIKLISAKIFNEYCLAIQNRRNPEAESFFEIWCKTHLKRPSQRDLKSLWRLFVSLLWLRVRN